MLETWRLLRPLLPRRATATLATLALISFLVGFLEAGVLVLVVQAGLALTESSDPPLDIPILGELDISTGSALVAAASLGVMTLVIHMVSGWLAARLTAGTLLGARQACIDAFRDAPWERQSMEREGALQENASELARNTASLVSAVSRVVASALALLAMLVGAVLVDWTAAVGLIAFGGVLALALRPFNLVTKRRSTRFIQANLSFTEAVAQWGRLAMELRVFGVADAEAARMKSEAAATSELMVPSRFLRNVATSVYRDLAVLVLVGGIAILQLFDDRDIAALGASVLVVLRSISYSQQTVTALNTVVDQAPNLVILNDRLESLRRAHSRPGTTDVDGIDRIRFEDVHYTFEGGQEALRGVTFTIDAGETLGVIGPSGAGKTTLVQLLLGLRAPDAGRILIDGIPSTDLSAASWAELVAFVPQSPNLLEGTIEENIVFLRSGHNRDEVRLATARAHLLDEVERMPRGLDTRLGPFGSGLSGGQRQRLAIARALLGGPALLVLDEPTSALDVVSESLLVETLRELHGEVTCVIVAHRIDTLQTCDRVLALADGRVLSSGSLDDALAAVSFDDRSFEL